MIATLFAAGALVLAGSVVPASAAGGPNLASGKTATVSSVSDVYGAGNLNDGNANTCWESTNNAFPQWAQIDLGTATSIDQVIFKLPPATAWATRTQTLSVLTGTTSPPFARPLRRRGMPSTRRPVTR